MIFTSRKWSRASLKAWSLILGVVMMGSCRPHPEEKLGKTLRRRIYSKAERPCSSCDSGDVASLRLFSLHPRALYWKDTLLHCDLQPLNYGADIRRALLGLCPGDSILLSLETDSISFLKELLQSLTIDNSNKIKFLIKIDECISAEEYYTRQEKLREDQRTKAYLQFDSLINRLGAVVRLVGRGTAVWPLGGGKGRTLHFGDKVIFRADFYDLNRRLIYRSPYNGDSLEIFDGSFVLGLHEALTVLRQGDSARIFLPYFLGFGEEGSAPAVPPFTNLEIRIRILKTLKN
ncbi:MAG: hypothetical protein N2110_05510 [Flavobacteriales bacterium]|nr:hypothetical protein [Flavobacteriales bacterium]MCX7768461.1 hypothetical protein [Flavobacteriales bacterium]MDW8410639.1 hypothetical protein [Flavobacteriales bacterium]